MADPTSHPFDDLGAVDVGTHLVLMHAYTSTQLAAMTVPEREQRHAEEHLPDLPISRLDIHVGSLDHMDDILTLVTGYRAKCIAAGFGEDTAELMAAHLHQAIMFRAGTTDLADPEGHSCSRTCQGTGPHA